MAIIFPQRAKHNVKHTRTIRVLTSLVIREMSLTNGKSHGGYFWMVIEPAAAIFLLTYVFTLALRNPSLGTNFPIFYASGFLPFFMFKQIHGAIVNSIKFNKSLLNYPSITWADAIISRLICGIIKQIITFVVIITTIRYYYETNTILNYEKITYGLIMSIVLAFGIGTLNIFLFYIFPILEKVWSISTAPLFILSAVLYIVEDTHPQIQKLLSLNPLVHITGQTRTGFYPTYEARYVDDLYIFQISLISLCLGLFFVSIYHKKILEALRS